MHWESVFRKHGIDHELLAAWLMEAYPQNKGQSRERKRKADGKPQWWTGLPAAESGQWEIRRKDLVRAIATSKNSAPGPDGLPYKVWRELGGLGVDILWDAMQELHELNAIATLHEAIGEDHSFNAGIMACLPKTAIGQTDEGEDIYDASSTRPLSIVNTDNRLMCSAARIRWESFFAKWISNNQKGFIRGRSMLSNVLKIDHEAMRVSLQCGAGIIILFDFRAAFPSVEGNS